MSDCADFDTLWHGYKVKITEYVTRRVGPDIAEDIVQDVYISAWNELGKGTEVDHISGWLFRIARNAIIDYYRWRERRPTVDLEALAEVAGAHVTHDEVARLLDEEQLWRAVERLVDEQAHVVLRRLEGYEFGDIADEMGKTEGAVKQLKQRAYASLCKRLQEYMGIGTPRAIKSGSRLEDVTRLLKERGPMTTIELAQELGIGDSSIWHVMTEYRDHFVAVGKSPRSRRQGNPVNVWGLKEAA